jgi:hypothetical protein
MDYKEEVCRRLQISNLEARLAMLEIEITVLAREITSALTFASRRAEATQRRDAAHSEASAIKAELDKLRRLFPQLAQH